jgi:hypothetical protein
MTFCRNQPASSRCARRYGWLLLLAWPLSATAEPPPNKAVFLDDHARAALAAATVVSATHPIATAGVMVVGKDRSFWEALPAAGPGAADAPNRAPSIDPELLTAVEDHQPVASPLHNPGEAFAYDYILILAHKTPLEQLSKSARHDLSYTHLYEEPGKYRGQLVHLVGRLRRLWRFDPPDLPAKEGVKNLYEGWIFGDAAYSKPYCVIASEISPGIPIADKIEDLPVRFDGYLFKCYRYHAGDRNREAPLLIGRAITRRTTPAATAEEPEIASSNWIVPTFLILMLLTVGVAFLLHWWFRRGDRTVWSRVKEARADGFADPGSSV